MSKARILLLLGCLAAVLAGCSAQSSPPVERSQFGGTAAPESSRGARSGSATQQPGSGSPSTRSEGSGATPTSGSASPLRSQFGGTAPGATP